MPVTVIDGPDLVVTLDDAKAHLQISDTKSDTAIEVMLAAAQGTIDGPPGWLGRAIGTQTLRAAGLDWSCDGLLLPYGAVQSITGITLGGVAVSPDSYSFGTDGLLRGTNWPWWTPAPNGPVITWVAGYAPDKVPAPIRMAMLLMVQDLWTKRSRDPGLTVDTVVNVSSQQFNPAGSPILTDTAKALLAPYRIWSL